ncbi:DMT family transporter [Rhizobium brockwellii]|uniref:DMT family transporter n=1 Tax=Rhizobium brockwellii TaxID=3019932 RepID=UPI003F9CD20A
MADIKMLERARTVQGAAWGIFAISIWASWMVFTRMDLGHTPLTVFDITALRFGTAAVLLFPVLYRDGFFARSIGLWGTAVMAAGAGAPYALVAAAGLLYAPAAVAGALIPGVMPLFATILAVVLLNERTTRDRVAGLALVPLGVALIIGSGVIALAGSAWIGEMLFLVASLMWAIYTVTLRRSGLRPLHGAAIVAFWSAVFFLPVYFVAPVPKGIMSASVAQIVFEMFFQGLATSVVSLIAFNRAIMILGASRGAIFACLVPALTPILAMPLLGEVPTAWEWAGILLVSAGVLLGSGTLSYLARGTTGRTLLGRWQ